MYPKYRKCFSSKLLAVVVQQDFVSRVHKQEKTSAIIRRLVLSNKSNGFPSAVVGADSTVELREQPAEKNTAFVCPVLVSLPC
ncbi:hypothetical protein ACFOG5_19085 [Pedobacter fastidiosus]|uniref:hypothetical protein n=1 Tax=Pedobacter fastidiosus TaxID=2765361 RepID=UPI003607EA1B